MAFVTRETTMPDNIIKKIQNLEEILSYQEQTIDTLSDVIIELQAQLDELENQFQRFQAQLSTDCDPSASGEEPPPPHY